MTRKIPRKIVFAGAKPSRMNPYPVEDGKVRGKVFARIERRTYPVGKNPWSVSVRIVHNEESWYWVTFSTCFTDAEAARKWLRGNAERIFEEYNVYLGE